MRKSEYALQMVRGRLKDHGEPLPIQSGLIDQAFLLTDDGDPRWIGVALMHLNQQGEVRYPACNHEHYHDDTCTVELVSA